MWFWETRLWVQRFWTDVYRCSRQPQLLPRDFISRHAPWRPALALHTSSTARVHVSARVHVASCSDVHVSEGSRSLHVPAPDAFRPKIPVGSGSIRVSEALLAGGGSEAARLRDVLVSLLTVLLYICTRVHRDELPVPWFWVQITI